MGRRFTETELRNAEILWLLELTFAGRVWRFSTELVDIEGYVYTGSLSNVSYDEEVTWASAEYDLPTAGVSVIFPEDIAQLIAQGHDLSAATGELSVWIKGSDLDDKRVVVSGRANTADYGAAGEAVSFSLEPDWLDNSMLYPAPNHIIDDTTWPDAADNSAGKTYPTIIGAAGWNLNRPSSPLYVVDTTAGSTVGLIAGHHVRATFVYVYDSLNNMNTTAVTNTTDALGNQVATVSLGSFPSISDRTFWVRWGEGDIDAPPNWYNAGGMFNPFKSEKSRLLITTDDQFPVDFLVGAGDVIRWALSASGLKVDIGRTVTSVDTLNDFLIQGFIGETVDILNWLKTEVLSLLPVSLAVSGEGVYPIVWDYQAPSVANLTSGSDIERVGRVEYQDNEIRNEISLRWGYNVATQDFAKRTKLTGDPIAETSNLVGRNVFTQSSRARFGSRAYETETSMVADPATAYKILAWQSIAFSKKHRRIQYQGDISLGWLNVGDIVEITDETLFLSDQRMMVQTIKWGEGSLIFDFLMIPNLIDDTINI